MALAVVPPLLQGAGKPGQAARLSVEGGGLEPTLMHPHPVTARLLQWWQARLQDHSHSRAQELGRNELHFVAHAHNAQLIVANGADGARHVRACREE